MMFGMRFEDRDGLANHRELIGGARRPTEHVGAEHSEASQVEN